MSQLIDNLNIIESVKTDIKSAIEAKGVDMTGISFPGYASKIGEISGGGGWDQKSLTEGANDITNLDNSASFVASYAFAYNMNIQTVNLPYATTVGSSAFFYCSSLIQVSLPMCSYIGRYAFWECVSLLQVNLPVCNKIDTFAFDGCTSLSQISLPKCSYIGNYAFYSCSSLSQVDLPVCSFIGNQAFYDTNLTSLTLGSNSVVSLSGDNQFPPTDMLSIYVPGSLYSQYITNHKWISYSSYIMSLIDNIPTLSFENGLLYGSISAISSADWTNLGITTTDIISVSLPNCLSVADQTFKNCSSLQTISLPMCEYIGSSAFDFCPAISGTLYFPSCTYLGQRAFGHRSLPSIAPGRVDRVILPAVSSMSDYTLYLNGCSYIYFGASTITFNRNVYYTYSSSNCSVYIAAQNISWSYSGTAQKSFTTTSNIVDVYVRSELVQTLQNNAYWRKCRSISSFDPDNFDPWNPIGE